MLLSVYIRTGETDATAKWEALVKKGVVNATERESKNYRARAKNILDCTLQQERDHLQRRSFTRVVWMVVTDSQDLKQWITETYDTTGADASGQSSNNFTREIVTTQVSWCAYTDAAGPIYSRSCGSRD